MIRAQILYLGDRVSFTHPGPPTQGQFAPGTGKQLPYMEQGGMEWVAAIMLRTQID